LGHGRMSVDFIDGKFATCGTIWNQEIFTTARKDLWSSRNNTI
jgi:hypothetical protein